jgi:hypothetical protein
VTSESDPKRVVSSNNPCPFLRALVAEGYVSGHIEKLGAISDTIVTAGGGTFEKPEVKKSAVYLIAMVANGLSPLRLIRSIRTGVRLDALRGGPLDKKGAGSRVLDIEGRVDERELARLDDFAVDLVDDAGESERGLTAENIGVMMDANFARAAGHRRPIDRRLMDGEWPVLLRVMGKTSNGRRYLSLREVRKLVADEVLPKRVADRLEGANRPGRAETPPEAR